MREDILLQRFRIILWYDTQTFTYGHIFPDVQHIWCQFAFHADNAPVKPREGRSRDRCKHKERQMRKEVKKLK